MKRLLFLLLPALIPSWRFFKTVEPSPRVQWTLVHDGERKWQEYYARPEAVSLGRMLRRMVWNPRWNEALFLVSLAERQTIAPSPHSLSEINTRVADSLREKGIAAGETYQFRILYVHRDDAGLHRTVTFEGPMTQLTKAAL